MQGRFVVIIFIFIVAVVLVEEIKNIFSVKTNQMKKAMRIFICCIAAFLLLTVANAQQGGKENYFSLNSPKDIADANYGSVTVTATRSTTIIGTIMAYGENVRGLTITFSNGYTFKLAPAPTGFNLNYIGNALNIVLQPGESAKIDFNLGGKGPTLRQLYVSGQVIN